MQGVGAMDQDLKDILSKLLEGQSRLEKEVRNNTIKLESVESKLNIVAEVQTAHREQDERRTNETLVEQRNVNSLLMSSLKHVSADVVEIKEDVKELKDNFHKVEKVTMQNTYDVAYLKSAK